MNLQQAIEVIRRNDAAMTRDYRRTVFDEYAIVSAAGGKPRLVWYAGPRREDYMRRFGRDTAALKQEARSRFTNRYEIGDFEFVQDGVGSQSESFVVLGKALILVCGNTGASMAEISKDPLWLVAQKNFVAMSEAFRNDPLVLAEPLKGPDLGTR